MESFKRFILKLAKALKSLQTWFLITIFLLALLAVLSHFFHWFDPRKDNHTTLLQAFYSIIAHFLEFLWLELLAGYIIWKVLEDRVKKYLDVPQKIRERHLGEILLGIEESIGAVLIFDNDINPYYIGDHSEEELYATKNSLSKRNKWAEQIGFERSLAAYLEKNPFREIQILLLHPQSHAAEQRSQDLKSAGEKNENYYDIFEEMKEGIARLYNTKSSMKHRYKDGGLIREADVTKRLKIKFFKASQATSFVTWNDRMNFVLLKSDRLSNKENYIINTKSPLAQSFIDNFASLWDNEQTTMDFDDYMKVSLLNETGEECIDNLLWGPDSADHHRPVFVCIPKPVNKQDWEPKSGEALLLKHNKEVSWVTLQKIRDEDEDEENREHAVKRIAKQYFIEINEDENGYDDFSANVSNLIDIHRIYKIVPYHRYKIRLEEGNYVRRHLNERGYCFTPSNMYDIYLGLTLNKTLPSLYDIYMNFGNSDIARYKYSNNETGTSQFAPDRIIWSFWCSVFRAEIKVVDFNEEGFSGLDHGTPNDNTISWEEVRKFKALLTPKDLCNGYDKKGPFDKAKDFVVSTIKADIDFILGKSAKIDLLGVSPEVSAFRQEPINFMVSVHFIQSRVSIERDVDPQADGYVENQANYTVMHNIGKKNITGGFSKLKIGNDVVREYNLVAPLDSLFLSRNWKGSSVGLEGTTVKYSNFEARENLSKDISRNIKKKGEPADAFGYRNLLCIEFIECVKVMGVVNFKT